MTFPHFAALVAAASLTARDCGNGHWQILGGTFTVNYYPGPGTIYVNGTHRGKKYATVHEAIAAARMIPRRTDAKVERPENSRRIRRRLLRRDPHCHWCRCGLTLATSTLEHKIPVGRGGSNGDDNLCLACEPCNQRRGCMMPEVARLKGE